MFNLFTNMGCGTLLWVGVVWCNVIVSSAAKNRYKNVVSDVNAISSPATLYADLLFYCSTLLLPTGTTTW